jgi:hypothetical protein
MGFSDPVVFPIQISPPRIRIAGVNVCGPIRHPPGVVGYMKGGKSSGLTKTQSNVPWRTGDPGWRVGSVEHAVMPGESLVVVDWLLSNSFHT